LLFSAHLVPSDATVSNGMHTSLVPGASHLLRLRISAIYLLMQED
jgi:hypothetical protein